ncbi:MAG: C45 family peptidase [Candidatus Latescibacterota bacterium]|nr:C45 family peptidase [Candidatus Latescibacterota bacterium]
MTDTVATPMAYYPQLEVSGSARAMGEQIGESLREEIRGFDAVALSRVNKTVATSRPSALAIAADCIPRVQAYAPHMIEELEGMATAAGISLERLMLLQIRNQLQADENRAESGHVADSGCTAFAIDSSVHAVGHGVVGQNWDNDPALDPYTVVLTRRPKNAPGFMTITQAGLISYIGVSEAGIGVCMNTLPAPARRHGVPHYFTVRGIFESRNLDDCVEAVRRAERAIPANIILATPQGPADLEITVDDVHILRDDDGDGVVTHTNHCIHPDLASINDRFDELIESQPRKCRIDELLRALPRPIDNAQLEDVLRDHDNHPHSICRHANDHPQTGYWTSVFSVVIDADAALMRISRGNPCQQLYENYSFN